MPLDTATIKSRLAAVSSNLKDNEAQKLINGASAAELKALDAEGVLRLYEALAMLPPRIYSALDQAAMKRLYTDSQFQPVKTPDFGVSLVKGARPGQLTIQSELSSALVSRIYAAEDKRLSWTERYIADGETIGRGQLGQPAYLDVKSAKHFKAELERCMAHFHLTRLLSQYEYGSDASYRFDMSTYTVNVPSSYGSVWPEPTFEDFVVAAYIAVQMSAATKPGRSTKDAARFAVALYHGMRPMVVDAQTASGDSINWAPVAAHLRSNGHGDEVDYVDEVVK
jgi:hypothetical protein